MSTKGVSTQTDKQHLARCLFRGVSSASPAPLFYVSSLARPERGVLVELGGRLCPISCEARAGTCFWNDEMAWQIQAVPAVPPEVIR